MELSPEAIFDSKKLAARVFVKISVEVRIQIAKLADVMIFYIIKATKNIPWGSKLMYIK